ncbi:MAG: M28 family peptidase [Promethearchaeota archaeon]
MNMIEQARIKRNLDKIAFPRLSGTEFELKAFNLVKKEIQDLNLEYEVQSFTFSSFYSRIYPKIAFLSASLILFFLYLNIFMNLFLVFIFNLLGLLSTSIILTRKPEKIQFIKELKSQNLLVKINPISHKKDNNNRIIGFISHIDSKGQRFKINSRTRIIKLWISSFIILAFLIILKNLILLRFELILFVIGLFPLITNMLGVILLLLNTTDNRSVGAVDNASGVACNLELVHYYSIPENRLNNYSLWFLFTGAEECGTMGIKHFYNNMKNFNPDKSIIFNFESIAKNVFLFPGENKCDNVKDIDNLLQNNNRNLPIRHYTTNRVFGTHSDGGYLGDKGLCGFGIGEVEAHDYMHTTKDTLDKIDTTILEKLCLVLTDAIKEHDSKYFN